MATDQPEEPEAGERLEWRVWRAAERPLLSVVVAVLCVAVIVGAGWSFGSIWYSIIAFVVLVRALSAHFFPVANALDGEGATLEGFLFTRRRPWSAFRCAFDQGDKILLTAETDPASVLVAAHAKGKILSGIRFWNRAQAIILPQDGWEVRRFVRRFLPMADWKDVEDDMKRQAATYR